MQYFDYFKKSKEFKPLSMVFIILKLNEETELKYVYA